MNKKLLVLLILSVFLSGCWVIDRGEKTGSIVKFSKSGLFIKTYECELIRGNMQGGSGSFGKPFYFTVENDDLITKVKESMDKNKNVKISYHEELFTLFRSESQSNFLDSIEIFN